MVRMIVMISLCALILCCATLFQDFSAYQKKEFTGSDGTVLPYRILYPQSYNRNKSYPLIIFLHGSGERGDDNEAQLTHGGSLFIQDEVRKKFPAIVVFPQCPNRGWWASTELGSDHIPLNLDFDYSHSISPTLESAIELTRMLIQKERVDRTRVYIMGVSMGGMGTFEAVYRFPDLFAAAVPICGGGDVKAYDERVVRVPFWIFHGSKDDVVDVNNSRTMFARLKQLRADVKYTEYPGVYHSSWDNAFAEPGLLPWLFSHHK